MRKKIFLASITVLALLSFSTLIGTRIINENLKLNQTPGMVVTDSLLAKDINRNVRAISVNDLKTQIETKDTLYVVGSGQSNMVGWNSGGDVTTDGRVRVWRKDLVPKSWEVADISQPPFNGNNNLLFHFAKKYAEENNTEVRIILNAQGGESILRWSEDDGLDIMWDDLIAQITDSGTSYVDVMLWHQGEALPDRTSDISFYVTEMNKLLTRLEGESWFDKDTPFIAGELTNTYPRVNYFYQNYRFSNWITRKNFTVASRDELEGNPADPIPYLHYTGEELVKLGREKYYSAFKSLYEQYTPQTRNIFSRVNSSGISIGENSSVIIEPDFDPELYINSGGIVPLLIEKEGGALFNILQGYRSSSFCPIYETRTARGTKAAPGAVINTQNIAHFNGLGHDGTNFANAGALIVNASEDWTSTNKGTNLEVWLNENGTTTYLARAIFNGDGTLTLPTATKSNIDSNIKNAITKEYGDSYYKMQTINTSTPQTSTTLNTSFPDADYPIGTQVLNQDSTERYIYTKITSTTWRRSELLTDI